MKKNGLLESKLTLNKSMQKNSSLSTVVIKTKKPRLRSWSERRALSREKMRLTIIDCALETIREHGVNGFNLQSVALAVGIQAPSLYEYFDNKNAIFDAIWSHSLDKFQSMVSKDLKGIDDFPISVRTLFSTLLHFSTEQTELYHILFNNSLPGFQVSAKNYAKLRGGLDDCAKMIGGLIEKGNYSLPISSDQTALLVDVLLTGIATRLINLQGDRSREFRTKYESLVEAIILLTTSSK